MLVADSTASNQYRSPTCVRSYDFFLADNLLSDFEKLRIFDSLLIRTSIAEYQFFFLLDFFEFLSPPKEVIFVFHDTPPW